MEYTFQTVVQESVGADVNDAPPLKKRLREWKEHCYLRAWGDRPSRPYVSQLWQRDALKKYGLKMIAVLRERGRGEQVKIFASTFASSTFASSTFRFSSTVFYVRLCRKLCVRKFLLCI